MDTNLCKFSLSSLLRVLCWCIRPVDHNKNQVCVTDPSLHPSLSPITLFRPPPLLNFYEAILIYHQRASRRISQATPILEYVWVILHRPNLSWHFSSTQQDRWFPLPKNRVCTMQQQPTNKPQDVAYGGVEECTSNDKGRVQGTGPHLIT